MRKRVVLRIGLSAVALGAIGFGAWILSLPPTPAIAAAPPIPDEEIATTLVALKPPKRLRPLIAIVGANDGTETTDYLMPYGILKRADVAEVMALATKAGSVTLYPALNVVEPQATIAQFDAQHPDGADYVIVPAMRRPDDPAVLQWIKSQSEKGAIVVGVCVGSTVVANAGLLDGKRATTHWYYLKGMLKKHPAIRYVPNHRFLVDGRVATTTGISASMPMSLTLIEAIAGRAKAEQVALGLGLFSWDARHASDAFKFTRSFALTAMVNRLGLWNHEQLGIELTAGIDEVSLALAGDAWSRTYRSRAVTFAATADAVRTRSGLRMFPEKVATSWPAKRLIRSIENAPPAKALDDALSDIEARYGLRTVSVVAMQLEYRWPKELDEGVEIRFRTTR
jgi:putative intracellular protease/amidase